MGTDIACWAERRTERGWTPCYQENRNRLLRFYPHGNRDYPLFTILGGARGILGLEPIVPPRGVPDDSLYLNEIGVDQAKRFWEGQAASWLTVGELLDFPWRVKKRRLPGYVNGEEYMYYLVDGPEYLLGPLYSTIRMAEESVSRGWPISHKVAAGRHPPQHKIVTNSQMERLLEEGANVLDTWTWIGCKEGDAYAEYAVDFLGKTLPLLVELGGPEDVRIVMIFH